MLKNDTLRCFAFCTASYAVVASILIGAAYLKNNHANKINNENDFGNMPKTINAVNQDDTSIQNIKSITDSIEQMGNCQTAYVTAASNINKKIFNK